MAGEGFVADLGKAALHAERDAGAIEQHGGLEALAQQAGRLQQVDEADRALEGDSMEGDERFFAGIRLDVLEHLLFIVDQNSRPSCGRGR